jgi:hypothetical protein
VKMKEKGRAGQRMCQALARAIHHPLRALPLTPSARTPRRLRRPNSARVAACDEWEHRRVRVLAVARVEVEVEVPDESALPPRPRVMHRVQGRVRVPEVRGELWGLCAGDVIGKGRARTSITRVKRRLSMR